MKNIMSIGFIAVSLLLPLANLAYATGEECTAAIASRPLKTDRQIYREKCARLVKQFPSLAFYLQDPLAFIAKMEANFLAAIEKDPLRPFDFDFTEGGKAFLASALPTVPEKLREYRLEIAKYEKKTFIFRKSYYRDLKLAFTYLKKVETRMKELLAKDVVTYGQTQFISQHFINAMDVIETDKQKIYEKPFFKLDSSWQGFKQVPVATDFIHFQEGRFNLMFEKESTVLSLLNSRKEYNRGFADRNDLKLIRLPTLANLNEEILMDTLSYKVYLIGTVPNTLYADGVSRAPKAFANHDDSHSGLTYWKRLAYVMRHGLLSTEEQRQLDALGDRFLGQVRAEVKVIAEKRPLFAAIIDFYRFNFHHDRGELFLPSTYLTKRSYQRHAFGKFMLKYLSGQNMDFVKVKFSLALLIKDRKAILDEILRVKALLAEAQQFMREFMLLPDQNNFSRLMIEDELTGYGETSIVLDISGSTQPNGRNYIPIYEKIRREGNK